MAQNLALGIDGKTLSAAYRPQACFAAAVCAAGRAELECAFLSLLPRGPLWDAAKAAQAPADAECADMGAFAQFIGGRLYAIINEVLWPLSRELSPHTAYDSLDDWLSRLGWRDCWTNACARRQNDVLAPVEVMIKGCPVYCAPKYDADMRLALAAGLAQALWRLRLSPVPNLASVNFILSSLSAEAVPDTEDYDPQNPCGGKLCLRLRSTGAALPVPKRDCGAPARFIAPLFDGELDCGADGAAKRRFYPGVMLAACLVRNMIFSRKLCIIAEFYPPQDAQKSKTAALENEG